MDFYEEAMAEVEVAERKYEAGLRRAASVHYQRAAEILRQHLDERAEGLEYKARECRYETHFFWSDLKLFAPEEAAPDHRIVQPVEPEIHELGPMITSVFGADDSWVRAYLNERPNLEASRLWREGQVVAGACLVYDRGLSASGIATLVVGTEYRRKGIGRALLTTCLASLADQGRRVVAALINSGNLASRETFLRAGFRRVTNLDEYLAFGASGGNLKQARIASLALEQTGPGFHWKDDLSRTVSLLKSCRREGIEVD